jgi:PAS domain S-box-containing protein
MSAEQRASLLLVDDREANLVALREILEPLGQELVTARSGEEALKHLLTREFAAILLDVRMPGLDGFETAELIKARERTRHVPIIFLTAISEEDRQVFRAYETGAVDYLFKPFEPEVLRSKVSVFIDLHRKNQELNRQAELLRVRELEAAERRSEERYHRLADTLPAIVWMADASGEATYYNHRWFAYTGLDRRRATGNDWHRVIHPEDLEPTLARWDRATRTEAPFEMEYRFRRADGVYRWHLGRALPVRGEQGRIESWVGTAIDIEDQKRLHEEQRFLLEAGALLGGSLDYRQTLAAVARAAVPTFADWCAVYVVEADGTLRQLVAAHVEPEKVEFAEELQRRYPEDPFSAEGPPEVVRTGKPQLVPEITDELLEQEASDDLHLALLRELGLRSYMCVPLLARDRALGAIAFVQAESGRRYEQRDLVLAEELARRVATAIDNSQLYREAEERARAARVLASVGDGVFMLDAAGVIRLWNPAAEAIIGVAEADAVGKAAAQVIPGWDLVAERVPVASAPGPAGARAESVPVEVRGRELWLSFAGVGFDEGTVYAFRDLTEERAVEQMKTDFVATVSHELRTPLAAIYGAALTIRRGDLNLEAEMRDRLLEVIAEESDRLASIVNDLLLASHLDSGRLPLTLESCDARELAASVIESAQTHLPDGVTIELKAPKTLPQVQADSAQLRQVFANLLDNAVKYSPEGGRVRVTLQRANSSVRLTVRDPGLGIPSSEQRRIFEKFYRLDPNMTRGIGGTGLGLYICRELVSRFGGRIWVESKEGEGSTFCVELPAARRRRAAARSRR